MIRTKKTAFQQPLPQRLISDSYYWKSGEDGLPIRYAYFHKDDDPSYTFLIIFDSSEAKQHVVYSSFNESDNSRIVISDFILEVESYSCKIEEKSEKWSICEKPDMVISDRLIEIVNETIEMMNKNKPQEAKIGDTPEKSF